MPIQFACSNCGEPIEVDDEHAGQTAACPYCRRLVSVPAESSYEPRAAITARPAAQEEPDVSVTPGIPAEPMAYAGRPDRQQVAATYARYALVCAGIVAVLFAIVLVYNLWVGTKGVTRSPDPNQSLQQRLQQMADDLQSQPGAAWVGAGQCGAVFFGLVGLVLAIVSLTQSRRDNWRAWLALVVCATPLFCTCGSFFLVLVLSQGGLPAG